ncbi:MAG: hypothetical protein HPY53_07925 [Brevinematales bacterium]|nr:hypothetical protein [Brevinematales bacterium]
MRTKILGAAVALVAFFCGSVYSATEKVLIDFTEFEKNMTQVLDKDKQVHKEEIAKHPELDFAQYGYPTVEFSIDDWKLEMWRIKLNSSANTVKNNLDSYCQKVESKRFGTVMGVRIHFPQWKFLSWALVSPPYDFFAYYDNGSYVNQLTADGENEMPMGVLVNVGQIKYIQAWVYGLNYTHQIALRLKDRDGNIQEYFLGHTQFDGWRQLTWVNPVYADDIRDRILQRIPLYPLSYPYVKFDSYVVYKPETDNGGDFIIYFKDVKLAFDRAIVRESLDIEDEKWWGILAQKTLDQKLYELKTIGEQLHLMKQEQMRMSNETVPGGGAN